MYSFPNNKEHYWRNVGFRKLIVNCFQLSQIEWFGSEITEVTIQYFNLNNLCLLHIKFFINQKSNRFCAFGLDFDMFRACPYKTLFTFIAFTLSFTSSLNLLHTKHTWTGNRHEKFTATVSCLQSISRRVQLFYTD